MNIETNRKLQLATGNAFRAVVLGDMEQAVVYVVMVGEIKGTGANVDGIHHWLLEACRIARKSTPARPEVVRILEGLKARGAVAFAPAGTN